MAQQRPVVCFISGYGQQTNLVVPRLQKLGHDVAVSCFYGLEGACIQWNGIRCYPTDQTRFGGLVLGNYAEHHGEGDRGNVLVMTLMDVWVLNQFLPNFKGLRFACWAPVDHDPCPPMVLDFLRGSEARVIAMSRFGQQQFMNADIDAMYVPHGVQTDVFKPEPQNRAEYRKALAIPEDAFVVGMVAHNQGTPPRKSFPQVFMAFKEFQQKHPEAIMYLHSEVLGLNNGVNLIELGKTLGIPETCFRTSNQTMMTLGIPQEQMNAVYNSFDVLAIPSHGEGFGIPLIEAQAAGCPVITTDWTAMSELCGAGWLVDGERWYDGTQRSFYKNPHVHDILDALEQAYDKARDWEIRERAREFALAYDVERVMVDHWGPVMRELEKPREVAPLRLAA